MIRLLFFAAIFISGFAHAERLYFSSSRWVDVLIESSFRQANALLVLFPGGSGQLYEQSNGTPTNNFLVRTRQLFANKGYQVVVMGPSSWAPYGYSDLIASIVGIGRMWKAFLHC